jgi:hypothetical protein
MTKNLNLFIDSLSFEVNLYLIYYYPQKKIQYFINSIEILIDVHYYLEP